MPEVVPFQLLPLDSVIQFGIALTLAYLNLERFRYRKSAPKNAHHTLGEVKNNEINSIELYEEYQDLEETVKLLKKIESNFELSDVKGLNSSFRVKCLIIYFGKNIDRWLSILFSLLLTFILVINTQYSIFLYQYFNHYSNELFWAILFFSIYPVFNTMLGKLLNKKLHTIANAKIATLKSTVNTIKQKEKIELEKAKINNLKKVNEH